MSNHPNRNWRRVMHAAADAYVSRYQWPDGGMQAMPVEQLRELLAEAYRAGYEAGRQAR